MKKLLVTTIVILSVFTGCAPKEQNATSAINTTPQRGLPVNGQTMPLGRRQVQPGAGSQPTTAATDPQTAALARFNQDLGFFSIKDKNIPHAVQSAAASVFQIRFLVLNNDKSYVNFKKVQLKDKKIVDERLSKIKDPFNRMVVEKQIAECLGNDKIADDGICGLVLEINQGTGFLEGNGQTLWTNAHTIEGFVKAVQKYQKISLEELVRDKLSIRVFIFDSNNNLVINPYTSKVTIEQLPAPTASTSGDSFYSVDNDYIVLGLEKEIGPALNWSKRGLVINHQVYVLGYPYCTGCEVPELYSTEEKKDLKVNFESRSPAPDSKGNGIFVTKGIAVMSDNTVKSFVKFPNVKTEDVDQNKMIYMTADGQLGMSGAPILDKRGEVIGVFSGGATTKIKDKLYRISGGVIPSDILKD